MRHQGKIWKFGNNINTDMIIAGEHLTTSDPATLRTHCFAGANPQWAEQVAPGDIVVAGTNFGCGSSREHAPIAIKATGVACIIAESFGSIFYRNAINVGLPLLELPNAHTLLHEGAVVEVDMARGVIASAGKTWRVGKPAAIIAGILQAGGLLAYIKKQAAASGS